MFSVVKSLVRERRMLIGVIVTAITASVIPVIPASLAQAQATSATLTQECFVTPAVTRATQAGVAAVGVGESVRHGVRLQLDAGPVYQDVLQRPDGSLYFASVIELGYLGSQGLALTANSFQLKLGGSIQTVVAGTQPAVNTWVLQTVTGTGSATTFRLFFPGDAASMLAMECGKFCDSVTGGLFVG